MRTLNNDPPTSEPPALAPPIPETPLAGGASLPVVGGGGETPLGVPAPAERADAARNRRRVLAAARRLFERDGAGCTSMDAIASEAGVGKGTLFRRFGDRASLIGAVLNEPEQELQEKMIRGAPPLGPGAPAVERAVAFGRSRLDWLEAQADLLAAHAEAMRGGPYTQSPVWAFHHMHLTVLVREGAPGLDPDLTADTLLGSLDPQLFLHQRRERAISLDVIKHHWESVVRRVFD
ncbi:MAG TPA: TetR/AcrR family transcriptional regulator [Conexibacter sp.]|jgi:AcrR family transcriptional regulator